MTRATPLKLSAALDRPRLSRGVPHAVHLVAELVAPSAAPTERPPLELALVLDTSGSMDGEKLRHVITSVELIIQHLLPADRVGLVAFSEVARTLLPLSEVSYVRGALLRLQAAGGTNIEAGLRAAAELFRGSRNQEARRAALVLSDGMPNVGAPTPKALAAVTRELALSVSTLGYGADHADAVLYELAEAGRGTYAFVPAPELCRVELARAVGSQAEVVAERCSLEVRFGRGVTVDRVLGVPNVGGFCESGALEVPLADFHTGQKRSVAFALKLDPYAELGPASIARLVLKQDGQPTAEAVVSAEVSEAAGGLDPSVHAQRLLCSGRDVRARAVQLAEARRFDEAKAHLQQVLDDIRRAPAASSRAELDELLEQLIDDVALMNQRPDAQAQSAFRRGQLASAPPMMSPAMRGAAFANVPRARLILLGNGSAHGEFPLGPEMVIGRTATAGLQLQSDGVSRQHTKIVAAEGAFWVNDLGSSNGTMLNGVQVKCERLRDGDLLQLGPVKLLYREG